MTLSQLRIKTPSSRGPGIQFALEVIVNASSMELLLEAIYKEGALRRYCRVGRGRSEDLLAPSEVRHIPCTCTRLTHLS